MGVWYLLGWLTDFQPMFSVVLWPVKAIILEMCALPARASGRHIQTGIKASGSWGWFAWIWASTALPASTG